MGRIVVPFDGGRASTHMLTMACKTAGEWGSEVEAVYVLRIPPQVPIDADLPAARERADAIVACAYDVAYDVAAPAPRAVTTLLVEARHVGSGLVAAAEDGVRMRATWDAWDDGAQIPLAIVDSPYRTIVGPLLAYIDAVDAEDPFDTLTVVLPEFVPAHWWDNLLHNQTALRIKGALLFRPGTAVISVPYHLRSRRTAR